MKLKEILSGKMSAEEMRGALVSALVPGNQLLLSKLGEWYRANPFHKYDAGDILILKSRHGGYGLRPVAEVQRYDLEDSRSGRGKEGIYTVKMHEDGTDSVRTGSYAGSVFESWDVKNELPTGLPRVSELQKHFKWNLEYQFKKVKVATVEEALALYRTRINESLPNRRQRVFVV
jgi:hypothetical protein